MKYNSIYYCSLVYTIDRIDSSKGYTVDNVQWVHKDINLMKNHFSESQLIDFCQRILDKHNERTKRN